MIEKLRKKKFSTRKIAEILGRSPNTISYEIKKNSVKRIYSAKKAKQKAYYKRYRSKRTCLKVSTSRFLNKFVERKLQEKWSPKQISGFLKKKYGITCSDKAIYKFISSRCLERYLFWTWNRKKNGRKKYKSPGIKDNRKYIEERPILSDNGHWELDFIVSKQSKFVLLVAVDRKTRFTLIRILSNRKRKTIDHALSLMFCGHPIKSITTDNDIAFNHWSDIEKLFNTSIYFTHPYCSWEKGLVENTNRWIRCFVPKKRDIAFVTNKEMREIFSFVNNRSRKVIDFRKPVEYYLELLVS